MLLNYILDVGVPMDDKDKSNSNELLKFISGYECLESPQSIEEIQGDLQLAGLSTLLNSHLKSNPESRIIDIGCGNGTLIAKLAQINAFKNYPNLQYIGFDFPLRLPDAFNTVNKLDLHSKVTLLPLNDNWRDFFTMPSIIVMRNVFHELEIKSATKIIYNICKYIPVDSVVLIQDMTTLPKAEKGNAGWLGFHLANVFKAGGIESILTEDVSKRGIDIFLIEGKRFSECKIEKSHIQKLLIEARKEQLELIKLEYNALGEKPENKLPLLRLSHDITAISLELGIMDKSKIDDDKTSASIFSLAFSNISSLDFNELRENFKYPSIKWFKNRGALLGVFENFLESGTSIFVLRGGNFIGKNTFVWRALDILNHGRLPLYVKFNETTDLIVFLEEISIQLGIQKYIDVKILASLNTLPTIELRKEITNTISRLAPETILIIDGFEKMIDPEGKIENEDIFWLIDQWSSSHEGKIIIESRGQIKHMPFERCQIESMSTFRSTPSWKPYGEYTYTIQLLNMLVSTKYRLTHNEKYGGYPPELIKSIDNHPYIAYVAGTFIKNNPDSACLENDKFIEQLTSSLYENLISSFGLNDNEREIIFALTLIKDSFSLNFLNLITDPNTSKRLLDKSLLIESEHGRFRLLGILNESVLEDTNKEVIKNLEKKWHQTFSDVFLRLYSESESSTPSFYRQCYYHSMLAGNRDDSPAYNLPEISECAELWSRSGMLDDAIWAYEKISENRELHSREQMRMASCFMRTEKHDQGRELYYDLFKRYESWIGAKTSYVDSILNVGGDVKEAQKVLDMIPDLKRKYYWHWRAAKCFRQLHERRLAYQEYEEAILNSYGSESWNIISELLNYSHSVLDDKTEKEWLEYAWDHQKLRSNGVKIYLGGYCERNGDLIEAETLLTGVHKERPWDAYCILPLVRTLCKNNKVRDAKNILDTTPDRVNKYEIYMHAKVYYHAYIKDFETCEELLRSLPFVPEKDDALIHRWGQWAGLFLLWSYTLQPPQSVYIAKKGLKHVDQLIEENSVRGMITCLELARITKNYNLQDRLKREIHKVNNNIDLEGKYFADLSFS